MPVLGSNLFAYARTTTRHPLESFQVKGFLRKETVLRHQDAQKVIMVEGAFCRITKRYNKKTYTCELERESWCGIAHPKSQGNVRGGLRPLAAPAQMQSRWSHSLITGNKLEIHSGIVIGITQTSSIK